jgi:hypothetical protein
MLLVVSGIASCGLGFVAESMIYVHEEIVELRKQGQKLDKLSEAVSRLKRQIAALEKSKKRDQSGGGKPQQ